MFGSAFAARVANSDGVRIRRRGSSRHVTKNQRSETTSRRSRDMRAIIERAAEEGKLHPPLRYPLL